MHSRIEVFGNEEQGYNFRRVSHEGVVTTMGSRAVGSRAEVHHLVRVTQMPPYRIVDLWDRVNDVVTEQYTENGSWTHQH